MDICLRFVPADIQKEGEAMDTRYAKVRSRRQSALPRGLSAFEARSLDARIARFYGDDVEIRVGALSAPGHSMRPGERDDDYQYNGYVARPASVPL